MDGYSPVDLVMYGVVAGGLLVFALLALYEALPARRTVIHAYVHDQHRGWRRLDGGAP